MYKCSCRLLRNWLFLVVLGSALNSFAANDDQAEFDKAWSMFGSGKYVPALELVEKRLEKGVPNPSLRANFYYLQGHLSAKNTASSQEAIDAFLNALQLYEAVGSNYGTFNTQTSLAKIYCNISRYAEAQALLEESLLLADEMGQSKAYVHGLLASLSIETEVYETALIHSEKSLKAYQVDGNVNGTANAMAQKGLILMTLGRYSEGYLATLQAQSQMIEAGNQYKHTYTIANLILYHRCHGLDASPLIKQVADVATEKDDGDLKDLLEFVSTYECIETLFAIDHQDPPPPPTAHPKPPE